MEQSLHIDKLIPGGQALGTRADGKKIMLWGALPGETVTEWQVSKDKTTYAEGIATQIVNPSPYRVTPEDPCYLATSPWQIINYQYELEQKRAILLEIFRQQKLNLDEAQIADVQTDGREYHYRNKMEYALYYDNDQQKIFLAFRARGTHRKLPVQQSSLEHPDIWQKAQAIIDDLNQRGASARQYQSLLLRCNQAGEVSGGLYENHRPRATFAPLRDELLGRAYTYSPNGFFQINLPVYELALQEIRKSINNAKVLDLYAGVGTIGLSVVADPANLTLVECDKSAYREMEHNCAGTGARAVLAKSEEVLDFIQPDQTVIVDPPRAGCLPAVIDRLSEVAPSTVIYLSCNPITQARDISQLMTKYRINKIMPFNFFPRTPHLENLIVLERR